MRRFLALITVVTGLLAAGRMSQRQGRQPYGRIAGVPYDFRPPSMDRLKESIWAPDDPHLLKPHSFGVGYSLNLGAVARRLHIA